jgi:hypothetical protein
MAAVVVPWHEYSGSEVENLLAALLVRTVPGAQRIDGSGGDDGVDVRGPLDGGDRIYQIKGFHGRLTASQKRQITHSLATAVERQPRMARWTLVLPLDLSPAEERWFSGALASKAGVRIDWIGRTNIEQALSANRDLLRAFAPGSTERRAMDLLGEYHAEKAAMARGLADGIERLIGLKNQIDLTDPDWKFDIKIGGEGVNVEVRPKDSGSASRSPIRVALGVSTNDEAVTHQVEQFMHYGRPVQIPSESILAFEAGLPGNLAEVIRQGGVPAVSIVKSDEEKAWRLSQRAEIVREGRVIGTLPIEWDDHSSGPLGGTWVSGRDRSGFLEVTLTADASLQGGIQVRAPARNDVLPEDAVPVLRFLGLIRAGDRLRLVASGLDPVECRVTGNPIDRDEAESEARIVIAEALARIQSAAGARFPLPMSWDSKDWELIYFWDQILANEKVQWYWPGYAVNMPAGAVRKLLRNYALPRVSMNAASSQDPVIQLVGHEFSIPGKLRSEITNMIIPNPRIISREIQDINPLTLVPVPFVQDDRTLSMFYLERDT